MGSPRTPGSGEEVASSLQGGQKYQEVGPMLWNGSEWERAVQAVGSASPRPHNGMAAVVPGIMTSTGELVPSLNSAALPDNSVGQNTAQMSIGLCNAEGNFDQQRNNHHQLVAFASEVRTKTAATAPITNYNWTKLHINLHITGNPGGGKALTVSVFGGNPDQVICRFPAVEASRAFQMAPGLEVGTPGNAEDAYRENAVLPGVFQIQVIPSDSSSWTYEMFYDLLV